MIIDERHPATKQMSEMGLWDNPVDVIPKYAKKVMLTKQGVPDYVRIHTLAYIINWYRAKHVEDEGSGKLVKLTNHFWADMLHVRTKALAEEIGVKPRYMEEVLRKLESDGYIVKEVRQGVNVNGTLLYNVLYVAPVPSKCIELYRPGPLKAANKPKDRIESIPTPSPAVAGQGVAPVTTVAVPPVTTGDKYIESFTEITTCAPNSKNENVSPIKEKEENEPVGQTPPGSATPPPSADDFFGPKKQAAPPPKLSAQEKQLAALGVTAKESVSPYQRGWEAVADWQLRGDHGDRLKRALAMFVHETKLMPPQSDSKRKLWVKTAREHVDAFGLIGLQARYRAAFREANYNVYGPQSLTSEIERLNSAPKGGGKSKLSEEQQKVLAMLNEQATKEI